MASLRIGHSLLAHGYTIAREASTVYIRCRVRLSIPHILVDCPRYHTARCRFFSALSFLRPSEHLSI